MKRIAYLITSNGEDGLAPTSIDEAFWIETERDKAFHAKGQYKHYFSTSEKIVDDDKDKRTVFMKLNALELLLLGI